MKECHRVTFNFLWLEAGEGQPEEGGGGDEEEDGLLPSKISPLGPICLAGAGSDGQNFESCWMHLNGFCKHTQEIRRSPLEAE